MIARRRVWLAGLIPMAGVGGGCAGGINTGPPISDPEAVARTAMARPSASEPTFLRFEWQYGDRQGRVSGDGVARFSPTDSIRLDLFASGDMSMAVALADSRLSVLGEIEDVELPPLSFLYAMAGIFRPGAAAPVGGFEGDEGGDVLVFETDSGSLIYYFLTPEHRLARVEEQVGGRTTRRLKLTWPRDGGPAPWPRKAEYRDLQAPNRVEWSLESTEPVPGGFAPHIYDLSA